MCTHTGLGHPLGIRGAALEGLVKPVRFGVVHYLVEVKPVDLVDEIVSDEVLYRELDHTPLQQEVQILRVVVLGAFSSVFNSAFLKLPVRDPCL